MKTFEFAQMVEYERVLLIQAETEEDAIEAIRQGEYEVDSENLISEDIEASTLLSIQDEDGEFIDGI